MKILQCLFYEFGRGEGAQRRRGGGTGTGEKLRHGGGGNGSELAALYCTKSRKQYEDDEEDEGDSAMRTTVRGLDGEICFLLVLRTLSLGLG